MSAMLLLSSPDGGVSQVIQYGDSGEGMEARCGRRVSLWEAHGITYGLRHLEVYGQDQTLNNLKHYAGKQWADCQYLDMGSYKFRTVLIQFSMGDCKTIYLQSAYLHFASLKCLAAINEIPQ